MNHEIYTQELVEDLDLLETVDGFKEFFHKHPDICEAIDSSYASSIQSHIDAIATQISKLDSNEKPSWASVAYHLRGLIRSWLDSQSPGLFRKLLPIKLFQSDEKESNLNESVTTAAIGNFQSPFASIVPKKLLRKLKKSYKNKKEDVLDPTVNVRDLLDNVSSSY